MEEKRPPSLKKFIAKRRSETLRRFTKLALEMNRCDVFDLSQMKTGLKTALKKIVQSTEQEAYCYWGKFDVSTMTEELGFSSWDILEDIKRVVAKERIRLKIEEISRGNYGPDNPAPMSTPIEILDIPKQLIQKLKSNHVQDFGDLFRHHGSVGTNTREYLAAWPKFTPEQIELVDYQLQRFGHYCRE